MKIIHIASEFAPIASVGGLGQVVTGLSRELQKIGHDVSIFLPCYDWLQKSVPIEKIEKNLYSTEIEGCKIFLVDSPKHFDRKQIYGYKDDIPRFLAFSAKAMKAIEELKFDPDILHLHDWHTSICAPLLKERPSKTKSVLTIHNMCYQGKCAVKDINSIGMKGRDYLTSQKMKDDHLIFRRSINLLKAGITFSDAITTVSPTYAKEILSRKEAHGLRRTIQHHKGKLKGILNGIDEEHWDPETDSFLAHNYSIKDSLDEILKARRQNKRNLQNKLGIPPIDSPLFAFIGRLVAQKGPELIREAVYYLSKRNAQFILLGSSPEKKTQELFEQLQREYAEDRNVHFHFEYDERLSRKIYSSADFLLVPSLFEPCGLTQLIALKYGSIPIVRKTGGLADTVFSDEAGEKKRNGYVFELYKKRAIDEALRKALHDYHEDPDYIKSLTENGMALDYSWTRSAEEYIELYKSL